MEAKGNARRWEENERQQEVTSYAEGLEKGAGYQ